MKKLIISLIGAIVIFALINYTIDHAYQRGYTDGEDAMLEELADVVQYNKELICNY